MALAAATAVPNEVTPASTAAGALSLDSQVRSSDEDAGQDRDREHNSGAQVDQWWGRRGRHG